MWDTWMFVEGDRYHLFTLTQPDGLTYWDRVCHAVSTDLLHWEDMPDIVLEEKQDKTAWDAGVILTGMTFACDRGYAMTYGAVRLDDHVQRIGLAFSDDLIAWTKHPGNPILVPAGPYYEFDPALTAENAVAWRDAYVIAVEDGYEAFIAANDASKTKTVNGCIAHARSKDLFDWELLEPIASPGLFVDMEVPQYYQLNDRHYLLFSTGTGMDTPCRDNSAGTYHLVADRKDGPYRLPNEPLLIGSGHDRFDNYVAKIIDTHDGPLLYHHITGTPTTKTAFAAPKSVVQAGDGQLIVKRWRGLDGLLGETIIDALCPGDTVKANHRIPIGRWEHHDGQLIGHAGPALTAWRFDRSFADARLRVRVKPRDAKSVGVLLRIGDNPNPKRTSHRAFVVRIRPQHDIIEICSADVADRTAVRYKRMDDIRRPLGESVVVEAFVRGPYAEVYVDDTACFVLNIGEFSLEGDAGLFVELGHAAFTELAVTEIPVPLR